MIIPTPRLLLIALCILPIAGLIGGTGAAWTAILAWLAGAAVLAVIDAHFVPPKNELRWSREHDPKLSIGAWNRIRLSLHNSSSRQAVLKVRDAAPGWLIARGGEREFHCEPGEDCAFSYQIFPLHRGQYHFGPVSARYLGPMGLAWKQRSAPLEDRVQVFPDLLALREYDALARLGRLTHLGIRNARRWGQGTEFERLRSYTPGDEMRRINWKATARRHQPIVTEYQPERSQTVILAIDAGRLMAVPLPLENGSRDGELRPSVPAALARVDYAVNASLMLAHVCQASGDRVGVLAFSDRVLRYLTPRSGKRQVLAAAQTLYDLEPENTEPDYVEAVGYLASRISRRALVILFTDLQEPESASALAAAARHLARTHLVLVVTLRDPAIEQLANTPVTGSRAVYERAMAMTVLGQRDQTLTLLRRSGVLTLDVTGGELSVSLINRYLAIKARGEL